MAISQLSLCVFAGWVRGKQDVSKNKFFTPFIRREGEIVGMNLDDPHIKKVRGLIVFVTSNRKDFKLKGRSYPPIATSQTSWSIT